MRKRKTQGSLSVQAIAGTHVVLLGMNLPKSACKGLLGFAIRRQDHTENESYWLSGYKTFASVEPHPAVGVAFSTHVHPIQGFTWSDFSAKPGHEYTYEVVALRGTPGNPKDGAKVSVSVTTETASIPGSKHHVHFNRGTAASQEYTRRFGDKRPDQVGPAAFAWLSRGAAEAIAEFIGRAKDSGWGLRVAAYEFSEPHVLEALRKAWKTRKVDVQVLYHGRDDGTKAAADAAIAHAGLGSICHERKAVGVDLAHNKTIVLTKAGVARAVLTGSTNFSDGGIYGHSNVVHVCEDQDLAAVFLALWDDLRLNQDREVIAQLHSARTPLPEEPLSDGTRLILSPRTDLSALDWYGRRARTAQDALFMTFAFGMHPIFQDAYENGSARLRYALMENMIVVTKDKAKNAANEKKIVALRRMEANKFAIGSQLGNGLFDRWLDETLSGLNVHVRYLHTKYLLVDPLGPHPVVVTGSANFSENSTTGNDENMLVIRGDKRVADIYLGEFMRLYRHFAFRDFIRRNPGASEADISHLDEKDKWWKGYFGSSFASRQREYFAG